MTLNEIRSFEIPQLESSALKVLDLRYNKIDTIPQSFTNLPIEKCDFLVQCTHGDAVYLLENSIVYPPIHVVKGGRAAIGEFYKNEK